MYVTKTCHDSPCGRVEESPKTYSSNRIIPLPKQILKVIKDLKNYTKCNYLIADNNKPVSVRSYQRTFELLLKKLEIQHNIIFKNCVINMPTIIQNGGNLLKILTK